METELPMHVKPKTPHRIRVELGIYKSPSSGSFEIQYTDSVRWRRVQGALREARRSCGRTSCSRHTAGQPIPSSGPLTGKPMYFRNVSRARPRSRHAKRGPRPRRQASVPLPRPPSHVRVTSDR